MRFPVSPLRSASALALVVSLITAAPASAFAPSLRTASLSDGHVTATIRGTLRTGAWRLVVSRPDAPQRLRVFIERGDVSWGGRVSVQERRGGRWVTLERERLDHEGRLGRTVCAEAIDACVRAGAVLAPRPGAQRLGASFRLSGQGRWTVAGGVRQASEPFILGPWIDAAPDQLRF